MDKTLIMAFKMKGAPYSGAPKQLGKYIKKAERGLDRYLGYPQETGSRNADKILGINEGEEQNAEEHGDFTRHYESSRATADAISRKIPGYGNLANRALGSIGSIVLGAGHELGNVVYGTKKGRPIIDSLKEAGEDMVNNTFGAFSSLFNKKKSDKIRETVKKIAPDGKVQSGDYYKKN